MSEETKTLDIKDVQVQTIFPGRRVIFEFSCAHSDIDPTKGFVPQLSAAALNYLKENNWTFDGVTIADGILNFPEAEVEDSESGSGGEDDTCWLEVPYLPVLGTGLLIA